MAVRSTRDVALTPKLESFVDETVATGPYRCANAATLRLRELRDNPEAACDAR